MTTARSPALPGSRSRCAAGFWGSSLPRNRFHDGILLAAVLSLAATLSASPQSADLVLVRGRVATVDPAFSIHSAMAIRNGRVERVGSDEAILRLRGPATETLDLDGRLVLPGLIDSHAHPASACMIEAERSIPALETIRNVLDYVAETARSIPDGDWIVLRQVFITRLLEQRYPTRAELDGVAPRHPVLFATGPDASLNSLALARSGIGEDFVVTDGGTGFAERDPATGELTGILRNCTRYVKVEEKGRIHSRPDKARRLAELFSDYNRVGLTSICERDADPEETELYREMLRSGTLTVRVSLSRHVGSIGPMSNIVASIRNVAADPLFRDPDTMLRIIGVKTYLDGGMLTGSAYMREPWGVSDIYAIRDPAYRGVRFIPHDRLVSMIRAAVENDLQFTAHSVGDAAVHALLDAYEELAKERPIAPTRPCISHSNFMSREAIQAAARLGVAVDIQPAWLHLDTRTLVRQFGYDRLRYFQPLKSLFEAGVVAGGGSDHMQKIGARRSINPYDPFLGMAIAVTRSARGFDKPLHPEEALDRHQAVRFYTIQNARLLRCENQLGSLETGKLADFIVLDTDILRCPADAIEKTQVLRTYVGGRLVWKR